MSVWNWLAGHPAVTPEDMLGAEVHKWLEKRRELKRAQEETFEAMVAEALPGEIARRENEETRIERDLMRLEIKIDKLLV